MSSNPDFLQWVTSGSTLARDLVPAEAKYTADAELTSQMGSIVEVWAKTASAYSQKLFSGKHDFNQKLARMLDDGIFTQTPIEQFGHERLGDLSAEGIKRRVQRSLYADLIPRAWRISNLPLVSQSHARQVLQRVAIKDARAIS